MRFCGKKRNILRNDEKHTEKPKIPLDRKLLKIYGPLELHYNF